MHFTREILGEIPYEYYPTLDAIQFASPGYIRYSLDTPTAIEVGNTVARLVHDGKEAKSIDSEIYAYVRTHKLNDVERSDASWPQHNRELTGLTYAFLKSLGLTKIRQFISASSIPFQAAKMSQYFYRRVQKLAEFEVDRLISLPNEYDNSSQAESAT